MLLCGAAGYFVARMLLEKSFRVFHCWKGCLPFLAALVALVCVMEFDLLGYERRLPGTADVASVEVQVSTTRPYDSGAYGEIDTEDPQVLEAVLAVHQAIIDNKDAIEGGGVNPEEAAVWTDSAQGLTDSARGWTYVAFQVDYTLQSGKVLSRQYDCEIPVTAWDLDDPDSLSAKLDALMNLPQVRQQLYGLDDYADDQLVGVGLDSWEPNADGGGIETVTLSREASQAVLQAVRADLADGSLGRHYLMDSQERLDNCFVNDLEFTFYLPNLVQTQGDRTYDAQAAATTTIVTVTLQTTAKRTLAALEQAGVLERPARLLTQSQLDQAMDAMWANDDSWDGIDLGDYTWAVFGEEG
jgi:ABC-2 type transport system permease protein